MTNTKIRNLHFVTMFNSINCFFFNNFFRFKCVKLLKLSSNIQDLKTINSFIYFKTMALHETLSFRKPFLLNYNKFLKKKKFMKLSFTCQNSLRKLDFYNFLYFFIFFTTSNFSLKFIKISKNLNIYNNYYFSLKKISVFPGVLEYFYKWPYKINFFIIFENFCENKKNKLKINKIFCLNFLRFLGFFI